jgi:hypothetical protein
MRRSRAWRAPSSKSSECDPSSGASATLISPARRSSSSPVKMSRTACGEVNMVTVPTTGMRSVKQSP